MHACKKVCMQESDSGRKVTQKSTCHSAAGSRVSKLKTSSKKKTQTVQKTIGRTDGCHVTRDQRRHQTRTTWCRRKSVNGVAHQIPSPRSTTWQHYMCGPGSPSASVAQSKIALQALRHADPHFLTKTSVVREHAPAEQLYRSAARGIAQRAECSELSSDEYNCS